MNDNDDSESTLKLVPTLSHIYRTHISCLPSFIHLTHTQTTRPIISYISTQPSYGVVSFSLTKQKKNSTNPSFSPFSSSAAFAISIPFLFSLDSPFNFVSPSEIDFTFLLILVFS